MPLRPHIGLKLSEVFFGVLTVVPIKEKLLTYRAYQNKSPEKELLYFLVHKPDGMQVCTYPIAAIR